MKRIILGLAMCAVLSVSTVQRAQAQPATGPAGAPGARGPGAFGGAPGRGRGGFAAPIPTGPSAPVPPQVAMLRPSAEEMAQINAAWKKFVASDNSPVLKKFDPVLTIQPPRLNFAATYTQTAVRGPRHDAFVEIAKKGDIDLLLDGDSITDIWRSDADSKVVYEKYFGAYKTANFAVGGDTTQGLLWGLKNGEGEGFSPKAIMLMIGTNNTGASTGPEIAEGIGAVVMEMRKDFPNAKILLLAVFPRSLPGDPVRDKIVEINRIISKLDDQQHVFYMDIGAKFLDERGVFLPESFRPDNLHPLAKGYEIWGQAVKDKLAALMK